MSWPVTHHVGSAAAFHCRAVPEPVERAMWWFDVARPAVALGSTQPLGVIDAEAAAAAGVEVVRRRSGGGAVWLAPGEVVWVDVVLPADDPRWTDDVGRAAGWLGDAWAGALVDLGIGGVAVHHGPLLRTAWSGTVCFAGVAPGEVLVHGRKAVGISQRRTRAGARFQCAALLRWDPAPLLGILALIGARRSEGHAELADAAVGLGPVPARSLVDALMSRLER